MVGIQRKGMGIGNIKHQQLSKIKIAPERAWRRKGRKEDRNKSKREERRGKTVGRVRAGGNNKQKDIKKIKRHVLGMDPIRTTLVTK